MSMHTISVTGDCVSGVQFMARSHAVRVGVVTVDRADVGDMFVGRLSVENADFATVPRRSVMRF